MDKQDQIIQLLSKSYDQHIKDFKDLVTNQQTFVDNQAVLSNNIKDNTKAINNAVNQIRITGNNINRTNNQILIHLQKNNQNSSASSNNDDVVQQLKESGKYNSDTFKYLNVLLHMMTILIQENADILATTNSISEKHGATFGSAPHIGPGEYYSVAKHYKKAIKNHTNDYDFAKFMFSNK